MKPHRDLKIASLIEHELGKLLARDFYVEGALTTITDVWVSDDLLQAKIKLSIIPYAKEIDVYEAIMKRRSQLEHAIYKKVKMRQFPRFEFLIDSRETEIKKIKIL